MLPILSIDVSREQDVVAARQRARQIAGLLGFEQQDQVRIATAVSEIARNAFRYARGGTVAFALEGRTAPQLLRIRVTDSGPGIPHLDDVLGGRFRSDSGMGLGIVGTRRLMDRFDIETRAGDGTVVTLGKLLPSRAPVVGPAELRRVTERLAAERPGGLLEELQAQNRELLASLDDLRRRQEELERLNHELEDTNRGVVALYAELDEKADHLRRADEMKSRFLSNMSHEFRTPLNSMLALTQLLSDRVDGDLTPEQETQVLLIRKAAQDLSELVNDLLDLAKVEAGKIAVRAAPFEVSNLFGALRGMLRPLLVSDAVRLVFDEPVDMPGLETDEAKVSQILRNFISNALKFTERGEVRVRARYQPEDGLVAFSVSDTGIGIAPEDQDRIFLEFTQLESPLQRRVKGTGLGLPLSRRLAELLGGHLEVVSAPGVGSTFCAYIPAVYPGSAGEDPVLADDWAPDASRQQVLVVEDSPDALLVYDRFLRGTRWQLLPARSLREARQALAQVTPAAIVLDIVLRGEDTWRLLAQLKEDEATRQVPVIVVSTIDDQRKGLALGADEYALKPVERQWLLERLEGLTSGGRAVRRALLIDDDADARYTLRRYLEGHAWQVTETESGAEGLRLARTERPDVVFLDLVMPGLDGAKVLAALRAEPVTRDVPVIIATSRALERVEVESLTRLGATMLPKASLTDEDAPVRVHDALVTAGVAPAPSESAR
jgi:signal transduction histidine kinase/DNA-binding response OmpR family regulator